MASRYEVPVLSTRALLSLQPFQLEHARPPKRRCCLKKCKACHTSEKQHVWLDCIALGYHVGTSNSIISAGDEGNEIRTPFFQTCMFFRLGTRKRVTVWRLNHVCHRLEPTTQSMPRANTQDKKRDLADETLIGFFVGALSRAFFRTAVPCHYPLRRRHLSFIITFFQFTAYGQHFTLYMSHSAF